jgi:hypothetical protein
MVLLVGAYLTWRQTQISRAASREELHLTREGQLTDRFTRAVEQQGSGDVAVRVGGIYALGRIADESVTDRASIADLLTAYVRGNAPWPPPAAGPFPADIPLDELPHLTVRAPDISGHLDGTWSTQAEPSAPCSLDVAPPHQDRPSPQFAAGVEPMEGPVREASLAKAWLFKADLRGVDFRKTDLRDANLREATADLTTWWPEDFNPAAAGVRVRPDLENADLRSSDLKGADLTGVSLRGARANTFTEWPDGFDWRQAGVIMDDERRRSSTAVDPSLRHRRSPTAWENAGRDRVE